MKKSSGRIWPYIIGISITLVFGFCIATIVVTESSKIQESDIYLTHYQDADLNANSLIHERMLFDKKYDIIYEPTDISMKNPLIKYKIQTKDGEIITNAKIEIFISRPETNLYDQKLHNPVVLDGFYVFHDAKFPKEGVWNIIAKVSIDKYTRFLNIKADTRNKNSYEF